MQSFHFAPYCSESGTLKGCVQIELFRSIKLSDEKGDAKSRTIHNRSVPFPSEQASRKHVNGRIAFSCELGLYYIDVPYILSSATANQQKTVMSEAGSFCDQLPSNCLYGTQMHGWNDHTPFTTSVL